MDAWMDAGNFLGMLGRLCRCVGMCGDVCVGTCVDAWGWMDVWDQCGHLWMRGNTSGRVWTRVDACGKMGGWCLWAAPGGGGMHPGVVWTQR